MKATADSIRNEMAKTLGRKPDAIKDEMHLKQLVAESFALVEMVIELQDVFDVRISQEELPQMETVGSLIQLILKKSGG